MSALLLWAALTAAVQVQANDVPACAADRIDAWSNVQTVIDGDTVRLADGRLVRFIAINTPELAHDGRPAEPLAEQAQAVLYKLLPPGSRVGLRYDADRRDRHQRVLAHVFSESGINLSAELIRQGLGFAIVVAPNTWQQPCYFELERQARAARRGIWAQPYYRAQPVVSLPVSTRGFARISGTVTHIGSSRKNIWLDLGPAFSIKIPRTAVHYFTNRSPEDLQSAQITARGWISFYNEKLRMTLTHPAMLESGTNYE